MDVGAFRSSLRQLSGQMMRVEETCLACCGLPMAQCHMIVEIGRSGQLTLSSLAAALDLDVSTVSRGVDSLAKSGYLLRVRHAVDRRYVLISLTTKGQQAYDLAECSGLDLAARVLFAIPPESRDAVLDCMKRLSTAIENSCPDTGQDRSSERRTSTDE